MAKISVIIPFLNAESHIVECLRSVLRQTLNDLEVICVDNGSTDRSRAIVEKLAEADWRIQLMTCATEGSGQARNMGMAAARGDYLAFIDADDLLSSRSALERLYVRALETRAELSRGNLYILRRGQKAGLPLATLGMEIWWHRDVVTNYEDEPLLWLPVQHQAYLMHRRFVEDNDLYYPGLLRGQDAPFLLRALIRANVVHCSSATSYVYRKGHKGHAVLRTSENLVDYVKSVLDVRDVLLQRGKVKQWHLVLSRTCGYLRRACPTDNRFSQASVVILLRKMLEDIGTLGVLDYSPYRVEGEWKSVREMLRICDKEADGNLIEDQST